jgi:hypothetical protein
MVISTAEKILTRPIIVVADFWEPGSGKRDVRLIVKLPFSVEIITFGMVK